MFEEDPQTEHVVLIGEIGGAEEERGEVLMVIQRPGGELLVHTKAVSPPEAYRLLTGGIGGEETAWDALQREIEEETGLPVHSAPWWGLITYTLYPSEAGRDQGIPFSAPM